MLQAASLVFELDWQPRAIDPVRARLRNVQDNDRSLLAAQQSYSRICSDPQAQLGQDGCHGQELAGRADGQQPPQETCDRRTLHKRPTKGNRCRRAPTTTRRRSRSGRSRTLISRFDDGRRFAEQGGTRGQDRERRKTHEEKFWRRHEERAEKRVFRPEAFPSKQPSRSRSRNPRRTRCPRSHDRQRRSPARSCSP